MLHYRSQCTTQILAELIGALPLITDVTRISKPSEVLFVGDIDPTIIEEIRKNYHVNVSVCDPSTLVGVDTSKFNAAIYYVSSFEERAILALQSFRVCKEGAAILVFFEKEPHVWNILNIADEFALSHPTNAPFGSHFENDFEVGIFGFVRKDMHADFSQKH